MARTTYARLAGFMFLVYIATAFPAMILFGRATAGGTLGERLAAIAENTTDMHLVALLSLLTVLDALVLGAALYAITKDQDENLALLALCCRVGEGITNIVPTMAVLGLAVAAGSVESAASGGSAAASLLFSIYGWSSIIGGTLFAVGSALFSLLFLRARSIPVPLAWFGIAASVLLVIALPGQLIGLVGGQAGSFIWMPMLLFEIVLGLWLLIRGVAPQ